jgi:hypothetical protein
MKLGVSAVGLIGPGIVGWQQAQPLLRGEASFELEQPLPALIPSLLPANERRRTTTLIKLALQCGQDALTQWGGDIKNLATVFASSGGDLEIVDRILTALGMEGKPVSPTHFHNSVHNAPAGYWSIAAKARAPSTSISAYDSSFSAGLLEAGTQLLSDGRPVLLIAYDVPPPAPLMPFRPLLAPFATAMLLSVADAPGVQMCLNITIGGDAESTLADVILEKLRGGNPAARALPLLRQLALQAEGTICLSYLSSQRLKIEVMPC